MRWISTCVLVAIASAGCSFDSAAAAGSGGKGAGAVADDIRAARKAITEVHYALLESRKGSRFELDRALESVNFHALDWQLLLGVLAGGVDETLAVDLVHVYLANTRIARDTEEHVTLSKRDRRLFEHAKKRREAVKPPEESSVPYRLGALVAKPGPDQPGVATSRVVEVGANVCDGKPQVEACERLPSGFQIRGDARGVWRIASVARHRERLEGNVFPLSPTPVLDALVIGADSWTAVTLYKERIVELAKHVEMFTEVSAHVELRLKAEAARSR